MLEENNFEPIPAGWYEVSISSTQLKQTKAGTGEYIALRYDVLGPDHKGACDSWYVKYPQPKSENSRHWHSTVG